MAPRTRLSAPLPSSFGVRTRIMFVTSQIDDVVAGLGSALGRAGYEVVIVASLAPDAPATESLARRIEPLPVGDAEVEVYDGALPGGRAEVFMVRTPELGAAAVAIAHNYNRWPDIVHAFGPAALATFGQTDDVEGRQPPARIASVGATTDYSAQSASHLASADCWVASSLAYARALCTDEVGGDLALVFQAARERMRGVPNGLDTTWWNPRFDTDVPARFEPKDMSGKPTCKAALQREVGLPRRADTPLIAVVGDLGSELVASLARETDELAGTHAQLVFHGDGNEHSAVSLATRYPTRVAVQPGSDPHFTRRLCAGADFYLVAGHFDPSAPNQLHCVRYGAVPMLEAASGLADGLVDYDPGSGTGNAIIFDDPSARAVLSAIRRAERSYRRDSKDAFEALVRRVMAFDLSWTSAAARYADLYDEVLATRAN